MTRINANRIAPPRSALAALALLSGRREALRREVRAVVDARKALVGEVRAVVDAGEALVGEVLLAAALVDGELLEVLLDGRRHGSLSSKVGQ